MAVRDTVCESFHRIRRRNRNRERHRRYKHARNILFTSVVPPQYWCANCHSRVVRIDFCQVKYDRGFKQNCWCYGHFFAKLSNTLCQFAAKCAYDSFCCNSRGRSSTQLNCGQFRLVRILRLPIAGIFFITT